MVGRTWALISSYNIDVSTIYDQCLKKSQSQIGLLMCEETHLLGNGSQVTYFYQSFRAR